MDRYTLRSPTNDPRICSILPEARSGTRGVAESVRGGRTGASYAARCSPSTYSGGGLDSLPTQQDVTKVCACLKSIIRHATLETGTPDAEA